MTQRSVFAGWTCFLFYVFALLQCLVPSCRALAVAGRASVDGGTSAAINRLHLDQQAAKTRRAEVEKALFLPGLELLETAYDKKFSKDGASKFLIAREWAKTLRSQGVIRINGAFSVATAGKLRAVAISGMASVKEKITAEEVDASHVLGMEVARKNRNEYLMPFTSTKGKSGENPLEDFMQELLGKKGKGIRELFEVLVGKKSILYDYAVMMTEPGADRQAIHSDMPQDHPEPPLFSVFCALQDVLMPMGPTVFLPGTICEKDMKEWSDVPNRDGFCSSRVPYHALLKAGDLIMYDPRVLHCGSANDLVEGSTRCMFTIGFRDPAFTGEMGYTGSLRPAYFDKITLEDITGRLDKASSRKDCFLSLGNGLL